MKGLMVSYKKVLPIKKKSMNNTLERWVKDMNGYLMDTDKEPHMYRKHSTSIVMGREIQLGATMRCNFTSISWKNGEV